MDTVSLLIMRSRGLEAALQAEHAGLTLPVLADGKASVVRVPLRRATLFRRVDQWGELSVMESSASLTAAQAAYANPTRRNRAPWPCPECGMAKDRNLECPNDTCPAFGQ